MNEEGNHNKAVLIIAGALILALLAAGIYFLFFSNSSVAPTPGSGGTPPIGGGGVVPPGNGTSTSLATTTPPVTFDPNAPTIEIQTKSGNLITVKNFYKDPTKVLPYGGVLIAETPDYIFHFTAFDQSFQVAIMSADIHRARAVAESDIPIILGIPRSEICGLKINLTMPAFINTELSGRNYGLSFCPNGIPF